jgi:Arylsulfotransferase (ASST)
VTLFDNSAAEDSRLHRSSRGLAFRLDFKRRKAVPLTGYHLPRRGVLARSQGNVQALPGGNVFVGWGAQPYFSEFTRDGKLLFDARLPRKAMSYRAYRSAWFGRPSSAPALAVRQIGSQARAYMSWNGSTELARWRILVGTSASGLRPTATVARTAFETATTLPAGTRYVAVTALDATGHTLRASRTLRVPGS